MIAIAATIHQLPNWRSSVGAAKCQKAAKARMNANQYAAVRIVAIS